MRFLHGLQSRHADAVELLRRHEIHAAIGDCGAAVDLDIELALRLELLDVQFLAALLPRLENVKLAVHVADVDLAISQDRRTHAVAAIGLFPDSLAGLGVEAEELCQFVRNVESFAVDNRRGELDLEAVSLPD